HPAVALHLGEIAHAPQEAVGDARRAAGAPGDLPRASLVETHLELLRRAAHDLLQVAGRVVVEPVDDAEAVAQGTGEQPGARRRADQREPLERKLDRARAGAVADDDVEGPALHRR